MRRHFRDLVFSTVVPRSVRLAEAPTTASLRSCTTATPAGGGVLEGGDGTCPAFLDGVSAAASSSDRRNESPSAARRAPRRLDSTPTRASRRRFEPEATAGLASSLKQQGLLQPDRRAAAGRRRLRADRRRAPLARLRGRLETLPALVRETRTIATRSCSHSSRTSPASSSPRWRKHVLTPLVDEFELSLGDVAERVGSKPAVSNRLRLLELPEEVAVDGRARRADRRPCAPSRFGPG